MKLVLYSGGHPQANGELDVQLLRLAARPRPRMTFIPAEPYHAEEDFDEFCESFASHGVSDFHLLTLDETDLAGGVQRALSSDIIFLGGGNTFSFLNSLRKYYLVQALCKFAQSGGTLAGLSAGAILMTPNIMMASVPEFDRDPNDVGLRRLGSLNLVNFEFFPHFVNRPRYTAALRAYSSDSSKSVIACPDGSGIIVDGRKLTMVGRAWAFSQGKRIRLHRVGVA